MDVKQVTDRTIKQRATATENKRVFDNHDSPRNVYAECSDGLWIKPLWRSGRAFGWDKWQKI